MWSPVDTRMVLEAVAQMSILKWSYTNDDPAVRHMGPMAEDFKLAFGLGDTDQAYCAIPLPLPKFIVQLRMYTSGGGAGSHVRCDEAECSAHITVRRGTSAARRGP